jgi:peptidyl-dipeptidase Dcp
MDLSLKSLQFGQNVLASTNAYFKHITDKEDLQEFRKPLLSNMQRKLKKEILKAG